MAQEPLFEPWNDPSEKPLIQFKNVTKRFGDFIAIDDLTQDIYEKEFFALLGPSGCGKTTMMRMLGGFETPTSGTISIAGQDMNNVPPNKRAVNMMFQSYALFPHLSIYENIAFGLRRTDMAKDAIDARVNEMLKLTRLEKFAQRKPHQISGGQRQRVALARSLAKAPKLLLLDEPLGALDKKLRQDTQFELMDIQEKTGTTFVIVTHDQEEAMTVASRVAVMDEGRIIQVATPDAIYEAPNSTYVADFIGDVNLIKGTAELRVSSKPAEQTTPETLEAPADPFVDDTPRPQPNKLGEWLHDKVLSPIIGERDEPIKRLPPPSAAELTATPEVTSDIPEGGIALNWSDQHPAIIVSNGDEAQDGKALTFAIRPEKLNIAKDKPDAANALQGTVIDIAYLGNVSTYHVELKGGQMIKAQMANARRLAKRDITWEDTVWVSFTDTAGVLLER
ncbi:ABC-type Fe3+/spermidine/putrescine transport system ATPase subunit [Planktotalea frisia]|jgi:ABC-type Fe3+/spermidine/putrescine transport system ATPase subunit|uniref:Spermidine/putrescine import ATP-binding protein PotA n=1 Tax=Planktotalea frisia TaxID=696762 RepID=A0A1L9NWI0_9RHOB|nr:ABC transporter ATP-binding protein [Planktotalea frisia]OJI93542.1 spermidine/putrescine import ATP-binding protein PotA [Planktotalea frisia]PZX27760.1 ABC-type Fe3+/spermidine/putrescine transport system ATPase subunit [Planktotalea frisia]